MIIVLSFIKLHEAEKIRGSVSTHEDIIQYIEERGAIPCGTTPLSCFSVSVWGMAQ